MSLHFDLDSDYSFGISSMVKEIWEHLPHVQSIYGMFKITRLIRSRELYTECVGAVEVTSAINRRVSRSLVNGTLL